MRLSQRLSPLWTCQLFHSRTQLPFGAAVKVSWALDLPIAPPRCVVSIERHEFLAASHVQVSGSERLTLRALVFEALHLPWTSLRAPRCPADLGASRIIVGKLFCQFPLMLDLEGQHHVLQGNSLQSRQLDHLRLHISSVLKQIVLKIDQLSVQPDKQLLCTLAYRVPVRPYKIKRYVLRIIQVAYGYINLLLNDYILNHPINLIWYSWHELEAHVVKRIVVQAKWLVKHRLNIVLVLTFDFFEELLLRTLCHG